MRRIFPVTLALAGCLMAAQQFHAQAPAGGDANQNKTADESQKPGSTSPSSINPFPEDTSTVPVMPSKTTPDLLDKINEEAETPKIPLPSEDLDPIRSPDDPAPAVNSGQDAEWSSSLKGVEKVLPQPEDDRPEKKQKPSVKEPTHREAASKDIEVGRYYLQVKNWKAAFSRFESALVLDPENPEVYWGLAEAQHHLGDFAKARANYLKLLEYDPDGPHGKQARKELKDPALALGQPAK